jgi:hypothetical protein
VQATTATSAHCLTWVKVSECAPWAYGPLEAITYIHSSTMQHLLIVEVMALDQGHASGPPNAT